jgi:type VI secretion system protein ImpJ
MSFREVHWHEGMFLRPQHFQSAHRYTMAVANRSDKWNVYFNWGLRHIDLDLDALSNYRFAVRELDVRLRDGTTVSLPTDGTMPVLDLKSAFEKTNSVTVYLAAPVLNLGRSNVTRGEATDGSRYHLDTLQLEDENTGLNPQPVQVRLLNLKFLDSTQDETGYETIPVARVERSSKAEATPELDMTYIPPVLSCDAWKPLQSQILHAVYDRIGKKVELLATQVVSRGISLESQSEGDPLIFAQLRELNEAYAVLGTAAFAAGVHPLDMYVELCRLVGQLSIFGGTRRPPELPKYDHDDLGRCFYQVKHHIDALLNIVVEPEYKERPFVGAGLRMQVALEPAWLESGWQMYIGVHCQLDTEEVIRLLTRAGELDMKIGSSERVDSIFRLGLAGLRFTHTPRPPRALPSTPGLIYFQINRESQQEEWQNVQRSLTLAIRLNENLIAGNIQGQQVLNIKTGGQTTTLQFTLYVVPQSAR